MLGISYGLYLMECAVAHSLAERWIYSIKHIAQILVLLVVKWTFREEGSRLSLS